jgi:hypothetical protein
MSGDRNDRDKAGAAGAARDADAFALMRGHATEVALSALADGQDEIVPADVRAHVDACDDCAKKLGAFARDAARIDVLVPLATPVKVDEVRVPWRIVAAGLAVAMIGAVLDASSPDGAHGLADVPRMVHSAPLFLKLVVAAIARAGREHGDAIAMVSMVGSLAMCALTAVVARKRFSKVSS